MAEKDDKQMPFIDHLEELRWHLIRSIASVLVFSVGAYFFREQVFAFLTRPYPYPLIGLSPTDAFMIQIKISIVVGCIISIPVIIYEMWSFIAPGLLKQEIRFVPLILFSTLFCFIVGAAFAYLVIIPIGLQFLASFQLENLVLNVAVDKYISFITRIIIAFGIIFELPILSFLLSKIGLINANLLRKIRPYGIVAIFVLAALLTPPDWLTQIMLAIPLIILYEISIWIAKIFGPKEEDEEDNNKQKKEEKTHTEKEEREL